MLYIEKERHTSPSENHSDFYCIERLGAFLWKMLNCILM